MDNTVKFHTLQLFVWSGPGDDAMIVDILEAGAAFAYVLKDFATDKLTLGTGLRVELHAYDGVPGGASDAKELGKWDVVWDMPARCRKERPCIVVDGAPVDMARFAQDRA